ncbi:MAG: phage tail protein [Zoogloea sp.]|nr:phage tail protein [Zoogloea sp.]
MADERPWAEIIPFRFRVSLFSDEDGGNVLCRGAFSEVTGLEASMAPKSLKEGGRNWGEVQLSGGVSFPPVILKRGITSLADLWSWFDVTTRQANYALRYTGLIEVYHTDADIQLAFRWRLFNVLPTKFKGPDLSSTASQVAVEELHLVHEGLELERPD